MPQLEDIRAERFARARAANEPELPAFRAAFGTGDLVLFHHVRGRESILDRIEELKAQSEVNLSGRD